MDSLRTLAETNGFFTRTEALDAGLEDNAISRLLKARVWTRVRQGAYTYSDLWVVKDPEERHLVTAHAAVRKLGPAVALSHVSATLHHGLNAWGADLSKVHVTRLDGGAGRTEAGVVHHEGLCLDSDVTEKDGILVTKPARSVLEAGTLLTSEAAVVLLDQGLHHDTFTQDELADTFELMRYWPETLHLQFAVRFADRRSESVGESRSRYLCYVHHLPAPELQFHVYDGGGRLIGITDMAWAEHRLLGEFDGKIKYSRLLRPGEAPADAVFREKRREDALREATGFAMIRLTWADLQRGAETAERIRRLLRRAA